MHRSISKSGYLEMIVGPMFSGKTSELQRRLRLAKIAGHKIQAFRFTEDTRYSKDMATHDKLTFKAKPYKNIWEILSQINPHTNIVGIDEIPFSLMEENHSDFNHYLQSIKRAISMIKELNQKGIRFLCAGLNCNFKGEPFNEWTKELIANADIVHSLDAICTHVDSEGRQCNLPATRTQRLIDGKPADYNDPLKLIGASDSYEARCPMHHFVPNKPVYEVPN